MVVGTVLCGLFLWQTGYWARQIALQEIRQRSAHTLSLLVENLRGELAKFRYQPKLLSENSGFRTALKGQASGEELARLNRELARINDVSGALDTYLMDAQGLTIAASNWSSGRTFIGQNFSYRPYFRIAMEGRLGRYFALGTTSGERGYYFAYPVREGTRILGAIVVKVGVGHLEPGWRTPDHDVAVVDPNGVIFLSSNPSWRFLTLRKLPDDVRRQLERSRKYANHKLQPLSVVKRTDLASGLQFVTIIDKQRRRGKGSDSGNKRTEFLVQSTAMAEAGWTVMLFARTKVVRGKVTLALAIAGFMLVSLLLLAANLYQRRRRLAERIALQEAAKLDLEARVDERTNELTSANAKLIREVVERRKTEAALRQTQADLVQASKLAALGQMSAGLSHELNQPLAAIRSYADNARAFLRRDQPATVIKNLKGISELTDRMARIIKNLRTYARDEKITLRPTSVKAALHEALELLEPRIATEKVTVYKDICDGEDFIAGGDVRLQQVFVNLISNALDAMTAGENMTAGEKKVLRIAMEADREQIQITFADNGAGFSDGQMDKIFDPFFSTKEVGQGMGLGLSITYGIVKQLGGAIDVRNLEQGGAEFKLTFARVRAREGEVA